MLCLDQLLWFQKCIWFLPIVTIGNSNDSCCCDFSRAQSAMRMQSNSVIVLIALIPEVHLCMYWLWPLATPPDNVATTPAWCALLFWLELSALIIFVSFSSSKSCSINCANLWNLESSDECKQWFVCKGMMNWNCNCIVTFTATKVMLCTFIVIPTMRQLFLFACKQSEDLEEQHMWMAMEKLWSACMTVTKFSLTKFSSS